MSDHVIHALMRQRSELAGEIEATHERLRKMILDLENLDATLLMFAPDFKVESIKAKRFGRPRTGPIGDR